MRQPPLQLLLRSVIPLILCWTTVAFPQEAALSTIAETVGPDEPENTGQRYDGYQFIGADGRPLPFQSDQLIEEFLATAKVESVNKIPVGVTKPRKLLLSGDGFRVNAVFKDIDDTRKKVRIKAAGKTRFFFEWRDWYGYDIAAYRLDRLLGLDRVPPVIERTIRGQPGSAQIWIDGVITRGEKREEEIKPPNIGRWNQQKSILYIFDSLVANGDSNLGNGLIDGNWRLWFIDCSRCFNTTEDLYYVEAITHCERNLWSALKNLDKGTARERLSPFLERAEIDALFVRRDLLVEHIQSRIDELGEVLVLFDVMPPTETASWANK